MESKNKKVVLLCGDSVLDNSCWLGNPKYNLTVQLRELLGEQYHVVNLAVDQMSTFDFGHRDPAVNPWYTYQDIRHRTLVPGFELKGAKRMYNDREYPIDLKDGHIRTFDNIRDIASVHNVTAVVLSIGGNDLYLRADIQLELLRSLIPCRGSLRQKVASELAARYYSIVRGIQTIVPEAKIIPVIPYHPHHDFSLLFGAQKDCTSTLARRLQWLFLSRVVSPIVRELLYVAQKEDLVVIDLSKTFNAKNVLHYGTGNMKKKGYLSWSGAEPSNLSSSFIAHLIRVALINGGSAQLICGEPTKIVTFKLSSGYVASYRFG